MGLRRQGAEGHTGGVEAFDNGLYRLDLFQWNRALIQLQLQQVAQRGDRASVDDRGELQIILVVARFRRSLERLHDIRIVPMILAAMDELEQAALTDRLSSLTEHMRTEQSVMLSIAETQASLKPLLARIAEGSGEEGGLDKATKGHIRNLDLRLERMASEMAGGREQAVEELRSEIRLLTRTLAAMAEEG